MSEQRFLWLAIYTPAERYPPAFVWERQEGTGSDRGQAVIPVEAHAVVPAKTHAVSL